MKLQKKELFCFLLLFVLACSNSGGRLDKKMIIIGMDGLDPVLTKKMMDEGKLPHFKKLAEKGGFLPLQTSNPPQSPVAWSDFISGHNPGHHDVFDFINRNPKTYFPEIGMTETRKIENKTFKDLWAGLSGPSVQTRRKGKTFWDYLSENNIPSTIIHCPVTFPAEPLKGRLISGMGTPDIKGTQGIFSYFTTESIDKKDVQGRVNQVSWDGKIIQTFLTGPKIKKNGKIEEVKVLFEIERSGQKEIKITVQDQTHTLKESQWSPWFRIKFSLGFIKSIYGICRFHLNKVEPEFSLYMTPVNIDPQKPAMKISYPDDYAAEIYEKIGNFYTQGMPYDTWALNQDRIDEETFLQMAYEIQKENLDHLNFELDRYQGGLLFAYFGITDLIQHMFWRYLDQDHPNKGKDKNRQVSEAIPLVYQHMDGVLGDIMAKVGEDTALLVLSDHGFGSFRRAAHVNSWLKENEYLTLIEGDDEGTELFQNVSGGETEAYSVGFGGIYINQFGRERSVILIKTDK